MPSAQPTIKLVIVRHGENIWNFENRFCGWTDVEMTAKGREQTKVSAEILRRHGYEFDLCHTSVLKRAIETVWIILKEMNLSWIPVQKHWRLNERSYGALQGQDKADLAAKYGKEQVDRWRWDYREKPPLLNLNDKRHPRFDRRYQGVKTSLLPAGESIADTYRRVLPYWHKTIAPDLKKGKRILISGHKNCLRALIKHIEGVPEQEVPRLDMPLGVILVYEFNRRLELQKKYFLE